MTDSNDTRMRLTYDGIKDKSAESIEAETGCTG